MTHRMGVAEIAVENMGVLILDDVFGVFIKPISAHEICLLVPVDRTGSVVGARRCVIPAYISENLFSVNTIAYTVTREEANLCGDLGLKKNFGKLPLLLF